MAENKVVALNLGPVTSYGLAKSKGFPGTEEAWVEKMMATATDADVDALDEKIDDLDTKVDTQVETLNATIEQEVGAVDTKADGIAEDLNELAAEVALKMNTTTANAHFTPKPETDGNQGDALRNNGDGTTSWAPIGLPTDEQTADAITAWLTAHPEATTTVQDGAITRAKLGTDLQNKTDLSGNALAPAFAAATANAAGEHVTYEGKLYLLPNGHEADVAWADTTKTEVTLGGEVRDLKSAIPIEKSTILNTVQTGYVYNSFEWEVGYVSNSGVVRTDIHRGLISPLMHNSEWNGYVIYNADPSKYDIIKYFYDPDTEEYIGKSTISSYPHTMPYTSERKTRLFVRDSATAGTVELTSAELMAMRAAVNVKSTIPYVIDIPQLTALDNYVSSEGVYPFTADSTLYRPGYPEQIVYSQELNGIIDLIVYANDLDTYFVQTLYAYHASAHESVITIANSAGRTGTYSAARSSSTDRPTETITINDTNGDLLAKAVIDWSRINKASGAGLTAVSTRIAEGCIIRIVNSDNIRALPITDYYVTNVQQRIYFDEIFRGYNGGYFVVTATGAIYPEITYTDRYVQFAVTSTKNITVTIVYKNDDSILASKTITVHCNISAVPAKKYMFIGDSYTEAGYMQNWFYDQNSGLVTLYGTRGTAPYLHEGRYGWRVQDYFHNDKSVDNPFYNPTTQTFDFSYYMANHPEFADVDVVNILLGRNNGFSTTIISQIQRMVTNIHDYNSNIKIFVMVGSNVAANNSGAGRYMQSNEEMNLNCFNYNRVVSYENATIIWQNCNLDDVYDFATEQVQATLTNPALVTMYTDNVHPSQYGYQAFGVVFNGYMHNLLNA